MQKFFIKQPFVTLLTLAILAIIATLFIIAFQVAWPFTADDSFITFRYSKHLAEGYGITWNIGEPPLEGYSNFTYMLFAAFLYYFHLPVIEIIRWFSLGCFVLTGVMIYRTMRLWVSPPIALLPIVLLLSYPGAMLWAVSGLETPFFQLLIVSTAYCLLKNSSKQQKGIQYIFAGLLIAIASLTRPEAPLFFIVFGLGLLYQQRKIFAQPVIYFVLAFTTIYLPYLLFKLYYFGRIFPNPVYCKFMTSNKPFSLLLEYIQFAFPLLTISFPLWIEKKRTLLIYLVAPGFLCFFMLYGVDPIVGYCSRYSLPFLSLLMMAGVMGLYQLTHYFFHTPIKIMVFTTILVLLFATFFIPNPTFKKIHVRSNAYHRRNDMRADLIQWMNHRVSENPTTSVVVADCGIIPLSLSDTPIIDSLCLNSREMTHSPINLSYSHFVHWVLIEKKPEYIILTRLKWHHQYLFQSFEKNIFKNQRFKQDYRLIKTFSLEPRDLSYQYLIYERITNEP